MHTLAQKLQANRKVSSMVEGKIDAPTHLECRLVETIKLVYAKYVTARSLDACCPDIVSCAHLGTSEGGDENMLMLFRWGR